jgi:hypothetical protein
MQALARQADLIGCGPMTWRVAADPIAIRFSQRSGATPYASGAFCLSSDAARWLALGLEDLDS